MNETGMNQPNTPAQPPQRAFQTSPPALGGYSYAPAPPKVWAADRKDRILLLLAWGIGGLLACLLLSPGMPGLGVTAAVAVWYAVAIWYRGWEGFCEKLSLLLFAAVAALALTFSLFSNLWLRSWNVVFLGTLMAVQLFQWSGQGRRPWSVPSMLAERLCLLGRLGGGIGLVHASFIHYDHPIFLNFV